MRTISLHDTRSGELVEVGSEARVGIYACGPTVYSRVHVGNARPFVVFSLLRRFLAREGYEPTLVINVTDVNDKIYDAANAAGRPSGELAAEMTAHYFADTGALGLGRPDREPLASETIEPIVALIADLVARDAAYEAGGDVFFSVRADPGYGALSHRELDAMDQGEGIEGAERKRDPADFALWKAHKEDEDTSWDSPWGPGRPGWHIECSAMAEEALGLEFAIHGGGSDLVFPHHENEAAQTRAARGRELARIWMHNGMLQLGSEKMAKSIGNIAPLHEAVEEHGATTLVLLFCGAHYRQPMQYSPDTLAQAARTADRIREAARAARPGGVSDPVAVESFFAALADDFNTPEALAALFGWIRAANTAGGGDEAELVAMLDVLGLGALAEAGAAAPPEVVALAEERQKARESRDFARADALRDEIAAAGWTVRDAPNGFALEQ